VKRDGDIKDLDVTVVGPGTLRLDFLASVPPDHHRDDRYTAVVDLDTARAMAIVLIQAIEKAETEEARNTTTKRKRK
jgi:hypothetical protein